jgi:hypothetical protein
VLNFKGIKLAKPQASTFKNTEYSAFLEPATDDNVNDIVMDEAIDAADGARSARIDSEIVNSVIARYALGLSCTCTRTHAHARQGRSCTIFLGADRLVTVSFCVSHTRLDSLWLNIW